MFGSDTKGGSAVNGTTQRVSDRRSEKRSSLSLPSSIVPFSQIMQIPNDIIYVHVYFLFLSHVISDETH
jgi:hypothetical protein